MAKTYEEDIFEKFCALSPAAKTNSASLIIQLYGEEMKREWEQVCSTLDNYIDHYGKIYLGAEENAWIAHDSYERDTPQIFITHYT